MADLAAGAALLGSGGGGDTRTVAGMARHQLATHGPVELWSLAGTAPDAPVACVGAVGSTTVLTERLPGGEEFRTAAETLRRRTGTPLAAVQPLEIGGVNALLAVIAAVRLRLPLLDADAMGRAFPRLDQTTLSAAGVPASPTAVADTRGTALLIDVPDSHTLEDVVRRALPALGGWCAIATHPAPAHVYRGAVIEGSVTHALTLGADFRRTRQAADTTGRAAFIRRWNGTVLRGGTVDEVRRSEVASRSRLTVTVQDGTDPSRTLRLEAADEYVLLLDDGEPVAVTPQSICVLDPRTWHLIGPDALAEHQQIDIFALPAASAWQSAHSPLVGLASYGLHALPEEGHASPPRT